MLWENTTATEELVAIAPVPSIPLNADVWHTSGFSFLGFMGHQEPSSMNWISSQSVQELRMSMKSLPGESTSWGERMPQGLVCKHPASSDDAGRMGLRRWARGVRGTNGPRTCASTTCEFGFLRGCSGCAGGLCSIPRKVPSVLPLQRLLARKPRF